MRTAFMTTFCAAAAYLDEQTDAGEWWNPKWRYRTVVRRAAPSREATVHPVEVAVDFQGLLSKAGIAGEFDPNSVRVVERAEDGSWGGPVCVGN